MESARKAAALVIGNEILSGKVEEKNVAVLAVELRRLGIALERVVIVPDLVDVIATEVTSLARSHDFLFTSGGVGPTHDDVTVEAVAKAYGVPVVSDEGVANLIRAHYKDRCTEGHLRMALVPKGAALEVTDDIRWPTIRIENTWLLPGIPEVFKLKMTVVVAKITPATRFVSSAVYTNMDEGELKPLLDKVVADFPDVEIGSYPKWSDPTYKTKLTFDARDAARVALARDAFVALLPTGEPQRVE